MTEKIFEERIVNVQQMPQQTREEITNEVAKRTPEFIGKYRGFAKVTYVTASPPNIVRVEPIEGTINDHIKSIGFDFSVF